MSNEKDVNSLLTVVLLVVAALCLMTILGVYMSNKWQSMRDIRRNGDIQQIRKAIDMYVLNFSSLPDNETQKEWDSGYDDSTKKSQQIFKILKDKGVMESLVFDPVNNAKYHYRYHKFQAGEYGCERAFAIFQVTSFEKESNEHGSGSCPYRDFVKEAPNGYTIQWFE